MDHFIYSDIPGITKAHLQELVGRLTLEEIKAIQSINPKKRKFEEIKQMAWDVISNNAVLNAQNKIWKLISDNSAWLRAEDFYNFAKQKEEEEENETQRD